MRGAGQALLGELSRVEHLAARRGGDVHVCPVVVDVHPHHPADELAEGLRVEVHEVEAVLADDVDVRQVLAGPDEVPCLRLVFRLDGDRVVLESFVINDDGEERRVDLGAARDALQAWMDCMAD